VRGIQGRGRRMGKGALRLGRVLRGNAAGSTTRRGVGTATCTAFPFRTGPKFPSSGGENGGGTDITWTVPVEAPPRDGPHWAPKMKCRLFRWGRSACLKIPRGRHRGRSCGAAREKGGVGVPSVTKGTGRALRGAIEIVARIQRLNPLPLAGGI